MKITKIEFKGKNQESIDKFSRGVLLNKLHQAKAIIRELRR